MLRCGRTKPNAKPPVTEDQPSAERRRLRTALLARRRGLPESTRQIAASAVAGHVIRSVWFARARHIAAYLAVGGEVDTGALIETAWSFGKRVYLPVLATGSENRLVFVQYRPTTRLCPNRFGILEPCRRRSGWIPTTQLDLVLMPLVAFDRTGCRLGMGGGYYDRSFTFLRQRQHWLKPRLLGLAYSWQVVDALICRSWDVRLHAVATEQAWQTIARLNNRSTSPWPIG